MNLDFTGADENGEFIGDMMEAWSLTLPGAPMDISLTSSNPSGSWKIQGNGQADATGCGGGNVAAICVDWGTANVLNGGGPVIDVGDSFSSVVHMVFGNDTALQNHWGNFHLLSVRSSTNRPRHADSCVQKSGGLISEPLGTSVPEPWALVLRGLALVGLGLSHRRRA